MAKRSKGVVFKSYDQNQMMLLPPSLDDLIDRNHPVRTVNQVIEQINLDPLLDKYKGGGTSSYHPKLLLKVLVYSYLENIYSSRRMEAALKQNIHFMWLSGMSQPDHNTINRFRSERLKDVLRQIFAQVVLLLAESGQVGLKEAYIDGTKIESAANRYTFVWGNSINTRKEKMAKQLKELWAYSQEVAQEEMKDRAPVDFEKIDPEKVKATIKEINEALREKDVPRKIKQKLKYAEKNWPQNLEKYRGQEETMGGRKSYSKTDPDATFMRMKEDHMKNGQLKPCYNWQISTCDQIILNYTIHQTPADTTTLIPHLDQFKEMYGTLPQAAVADAGYGSDENYQYLEQGQIEGYVKYNYFDLDQRGPNKKNPFAVENLHYNPRQDLYYCPMGQPMRQTGTTKRKTANGFEQAISIYQAKNCNGCPLRGTCHRGSGNRTVKVNHRLVHHKQKASALLKSEEGIRHRKKRCADVEAVFGAIKHNRGFRRFMLRGIDKVTVEAGLLALAHNLKKIAA